MQTAPLNNAQIEVLKALPFLKTNEELMEFKQIIADYFARKADEEMDKLWENGEWNEEKLAEMEDVHYRTKY